MWLVRKLQVDWGSSKTNSCQLWLWKCGNIWLFLTFTIQVVWTLTYGDPPLFFRVRTGGVGWLSSPAEASRVYIHFLVVWFIFSNKHLNMHSRTYGFDWWKTLLVTSTEMTTIEHAQNAAWGITATSAHRGRASPRFEAMIRKKQKKQLFNTTMWKVMFYIRVPMIGFRLNVLLRTSACRWAETPSPSAALHISAEVLSLSPSAGPHLPAEPEKHSRFHLSNYYHVAVTFTFYN